MAYIGNRFINRRRMLHEGLGLTAGALILRPTALRAADKAQTAVPPSVVTMPPRKWGIDVPSRLMGE
jgi:hypothetical protein